MATRLDEIRKIRLEKLSKLRELGINPYPPKYSREFIKISQAREEKSNVDVVGRLWSMREHGNVVFADLRDASGQIQLLFQKKVLGDNFKILKLLDAGDFLGVHGQITITQAGEITVDVQSFELLTKSLRQMPDSWEGLDDIEERFRRRYLDILVNPGIKEIFERKSKFWEVNRQFLKDRGFVEVETPILENVTGGADARPFITHHNALDQDFFLRISTELYLKRLVGAGFEKVFTLGPNFRNEGIDDEHLPEYYQVEWYWAYADYRSNMKLTQEMFRYIAKEVYGKTKFSAHGHEFDLADEWTEIDYAKSINDKFGIDIFKSTDKEMLEILKENKIKLGGEINRLRLIDNLWKIIRKDISGPAFLINEPKFMSPLAKSKSNNPEITERFHIILAGSELGNGYSELNDPQDQLERFKEQQGARDSGDDEAQMLDIDFVEMLEYGMPPTSGYAHSERLFWFLEGISGKEGTIFPLLRRKISDSTREIYGIKEDVKPKKTTNVTDYSISDEVKKSYPGVSFAYTVIKGVKIKKSDAKLEELKKQTLDLRKSLTLEEVSELPPIKTYRKMLKSTGVDTGSRRPSPEALIRRIVQGKNLYNINTAVDAYNLAVVETAVGLGGFDFSHISEPVTLRFAKEGEQMHLLGDEESTSTKEGEIVYSDGDKLLTLDLNYRDINATKITEKTKDIILFADGGSDIDPKDVISALDRGVEYIVQFCGGEKSETKLIQ